MPQSREQEADPEVEIHAAFAFAVASQGDVEVVHDEAPQGDMPAPPELGDGTRGVRVVEVFGELESHDAAQADGHVGITGKVEINLEGISQGDQPGGGAVEGGEAGGKVGSIQYAIHIGPHDIGDEDLLAQTDYKAIEPLKPVGIARFTVADLVGHLVVTNDGAGDELRKHGDVEHEVAKPLHGLVDPPIGIECVSDALEREERNADGEEDVTPFVGRFAGQTPQEVQVLHGEVAVFVEQQQSYGDEDGEAAEPFLSPRVFGMAHPSYQIEVGDDREHQLEDEPWRAPSIKHQRGEQQHIVAGLLRHEEIHQKEHRHEVK